MYLDREELARISEQKTDNILDDVEEEVQEIDPTVSSSFECKARLLLDSIIVS